MNIKQGEVYWVNFSPAVGSELKGLHPGVVIQSSDINDSGINTVVVVGVTSNMKLKKIPGNVFLRKGDCNLPKDSVVNVSQIHAMDRSRIKEKIGTLSELQLEHVFFGLDILFNR